MTEIARLPEEQVLVRMEQAQRALQEARTLSEVKSVHDGMEAICEWLRRQEDIGLELVNVANSLRIDAKARIGEFLAQPDTVRHQRGRPEKTCQTGTFSPPTHNEIGIPRKTAQRFREIASVPVETRHKMADEATKQGKELTQDAVIKAARKAAQPKPYETPPLPIGKWERILADPPWKTNFRRGTGRDFENHYPPMELDAIKALPVADLAAKDCTLILWAVSMLLPQALQVMQAWGFEFKASAVWVKDRIGQGYYWRLQHEYILLGTRGSPGAPADADRFPSVIYADKGRHSEKPVEVHEMIEQMFPTGRRIELFARAARPGWALWGAEAPKE